MSRLMQNTLSTFRDNKLTNTSHKLQLPILNYKILNFVTYRKHLYVKINKVNIFNTFLYKFYHKNNIRLLDERI